MKRSNFLQRFQICLSLFSSQGSNMFKFDRNYRKNPQQSTSVFQVDRSHPPMPEAAMTDYYLLDIRCPFCQKSFAHKSSMSRHKMTCKFNDNPKVKLHCGVCRKGFSQRWMLQKHLTESECKSLGFSSPFQN